MRQALKMLQPQSVAVMNGSAAVLKLTKGYLLVVPHCTDVSKGTYKIFYSETGDFRADAALQLEGTVNPRNSRTHVGNHSLLVAADGEGESEISLDVGVQDEGLAVVHQTMPSKKTVQNLKFQFNSPLPDNKLWQRWSSRKETSDQDHKATKPSRVRTPVRTFFARPAGLLSLSQKPPFGDCTR
jgi:hypothetical protein